MFKKRHTIPLAFLILTVVSLPGFTQELPDSVPLPRARPAATPAFVPVPVPAPDSSPISIPEPAGPVASDVAEAVSDITFPPSLSTLPRNRSQAPLVTTVAAAPTILVPPTQSAQADTPATALLPRVSSHDNGIAPVNGSLKQALDALDKNQQSVALGIHKGMKPSLDRTLLTYILAIGGYQDLTAAEIKTYYDANPGWPSRDLIARRVEEAVTRETTTGAEMARAFGNLVPDSTSAGIEVAISQAIAGNKSQAARIISPIWRGNALDAKTESRILSNLGSVLTNADHFERASYLLYRDRATGALRLNRYLNASQTKLIEARAAVVRQERNAGTKLDAVPSSMRNDPGYIFSSIQYLRRQGKETQAADLLLKSPLEEDELINRDVWWDERRLIARIMLNNGDARRAYRIAARHSAKPGKDHSEAEFHAGFFALRYLNDPKTAAVHFEKSWQGASSTRDKSRGLYWQGRAWEATGDRTTALKFYKAASNPTVYYGQLALEETGVKHLNLSSPPNPSASDKAQFERNELVRAIKRLKAVGHEDRASPIFRHLARVLSSPAQVALAHQLAQSYDMHQEAVQIGQIALGRDMPAEKLAFPLHVLPMGVKTNGIDIALIYALTKQESVFNIKAVSHANARGLMQMLPATAKTTARKLGVSYSASKLTSDPKYAVLLGSAFLKENLERFGGSYILTFAAYNAGPGRPPEWIERFGDPRTNDVSAIDWIERIPFSETRDYVMKLVENLQVYESRIHNETLDISKDLKRGTP